LGISSISFPVELEQSMWRWAADTDAVEQAVNLAFNRSLASELIEDSNEALRIRSVKFLILHTEQKSKYQTHGDS
jgi:hypothetical protein